MPRSKNHLRVIKHEYHRNGISGNGFHVVIFDWTEPNDAQKNMCAFLFEETGSIAVTQIDMLKEHNIEFACGNSWRGDHFEGAIREFIKAEEDKYWKDKIKESKDLDYEPTE
jgi:hypothetical protein